jgi:regulatory protein
MQVIRIVKKGKNDVIIHFDDEKNLILALEVFLKSGLKKTDKISEDRFLFLIEQNKLYHIKQRAFRLLGRRQHSTSELKRKLWNKDYDSKLIDKVIEDLNKQGYLDDKKFVREFVAEKSRAKSWSIKKIKSELIKKGIAIKMIDEILIDQPKETEQENAFKLAQKKYDQLHNRKLEPKELKMKLITFLLSKGFEYDFVKEVCGKLINESYEEY